MFKKLLLCGIATLCAAGTMKADTIGPNNCPSCLGSSYNLSYSATGNPDAFNVTLVVNTSGFTNPTTDFLNAVSLKITSGNPTVTLVSAPATFTSVQSGGLNAGGCNGTGSGFFCSQSTGLGLPVGAAGDIYTFNYLVTVGSPADLMTGMLAAHVKALYVTSGGKQNGITSEDITLQPGTTSPVPEPSSLILLGTGILGVAAAMKRRLSA